LDPLSNQYSFYTLSLVSGLHLIVFDLQLQSGEFLRSKIPNHHYSCKPHPLSFLSLWNLLVANQSGQYLSNLRLEGIAH